MAVDDPVRRSTCGGCRAKVEIFPNIILFVVKKNQRDRGTGRRRDRGTGRRRDGTEVGRRDRGTGRRRIKAISGKETRTSE